MRESCGHEYQRTVNRFSCSELTIFVCAVSAIKECKAYAQAVGQQATEIDGKVCAEKKVWANSATTDDGTGERGRWSCVDHAASSKTANTVHDNRKSFKWRFGDITKLETQGVKPDSDSKSNQGWPSTGAKTNDTAHGMAEDIGKLLRPEKTKVAGLLSKTITGA